MKITFPVFAMIGVMLITLIFLGVSYSQSRFLSSLPDICNNEDYLTPEGPITCCGGQGLVPGISFEKYWEKCATPNDQETTANSTLWRVYDCIVDNHLKEAGTNNLTLNNFANVMTRLYPIDRRVSIFERICKASDLAYSARKSRLEVLKSIRRKYYEIEMAVCSKNFTVYSLRMKVYPTYEKIYMRGGRCLNSEVPIDPNYFPRAPFKETLAVWKSLMEMVTTNKSDSDNVDLRKTCDIYANWIANEVATADEIFGPPKLSRMFQRLKPSWANKNFSLTMIQQMNSYWAHSFLIPASQYLHNDDFLLTGIGEASNNFWLQNQLVSQARRFFDLKLKSEFTGLINESKAKAMMVSCLVSTFMKVSIAETSSYLLCRKRT